MNYYQRIRDLREDNDLNQRQLAQILQTTQHQVSKYETGKQMMGIDKYIKLAKYFNVSLDYLAGLIDQPERLERFQKGGKQMPEFLQALYEFGPIWIGIIAVVAVAIFIGYIIGKLTGKIRQIHTIPAEPQSVGYFIKRQAHETLRNQQQIFYV